LFKLWLRANYLSTHLEQLSVDWIKIDKLLSRDIESSYLNSLRISLIELKLNSLRSSASLQMSIKLQEFPLVFPKLILIPLKLGYGSTGLLEWYISLLLLLLKVFCWVLITWFMTDSLETIEISCVCILRISWVKFFCRIVLVIVCILSILLLVSSNGIVTILIILSSILFKGFESKKILLTFEST